MHGACMGAGLLADGGILLQVLGLACGWEWDSLGGTTRMAPRPINGRAMACHAMPCHDARLQAAPLNCRAFRSDRHPSQQTREAISHARAAGCPIVVAITKCDTERANAAKVRQQLVAAGLELEEVGGNVQVGLELCVHMLSSHCETPAWR